MPDRAELIGEMDFAQVPGAKGADMPKGAPATIQERAWSSPIWSTPGT